MLNANGKVNLTINPKKEEKKYSWSTVFAWLYLKTIGRLLLKKWNKWAENILYYDKSTEDNGVQTDVSETADKSVEANLESEREKLEETSKQECKEYIGQLEDFEMLLEDYGTVKKIDDSILEVGEIGKELEDFYADLKKLMDRPKLQDIDSTQLRSNVEGVYSASVLFQEKEGKNDTPNSYMNTISSINISLLSRAWSS